MDLAELLMLDHLAIRSKGHWNIPGRSTEVFIDFATFIDDCHVQVEEKVFFPAITEFEWEDKESFGKTVDRIKADHKLIKTLGDNLKKWLSSGNSNFELRLPLYYKTVEEHNSSEEKSIFNRWPLLSEEVRKNAMKESLDIIDGFGIDKYISETESSKEFILYIKNVK